MKRRVTGLFLAAAVGLTVTTAAFGDTGAVADEVIYTVLPITPAQIREIRSLLRSPGTVAVDLVETAGAVAETASTLPADLVHDLVTAPVRDCMSSAVSSRIRSSSWRAHRTRHAASSVTR